MRPENSSPNADLTGVRRLVVDDDELRVASGETNLDTPRLELAADLESGRPEEVEQTQMERRLKRIGPCGARRRPSPRLRAQQRPRAPVAWPGCGFRAAS